MNILIRSAKIVDPSSAHNGEKMDILIENGEITEIKNKIKSDKTKIIEGKNIHVSPGWLDMQVNFCDPGFEHKEDLESGLKCASSGGFTGVCLMPSTNPPLHNKSQIDYVLNKSKGNIVDVYPIGCISHNQNGKDLAEMHDMKNAGAIAFSDGKKIVNDAGLILRALQYSHGIGSFIIAHCDDETISQGGQINEGEVSTLLGVKGIPALSEELMVERNLSILAYTGGKLHIPTISTKNSVELIKQAKIKGLNVTAGVAAINLHLDDTALHDFESNLKLNPPLRTKEDIDALKKGLLNGIIDVIVSDHTPEERENKELEFDYASFGMIGLETAYALVQTSCGKKLSIEQIVNVLSIKPRTIIGVSVPKIKEGEKANLTIFDPESDWIYQQNKSYSKSKNSPFFEEKFKGKVIGIINNNHSSFSK